jgi:prevent-host-death family protein
MMIDSNNIVPVSEARIRLNDMVNTTLPSKPYFISKAGKPKAVLVNVADYEEFLKLKAASELMRLTNKARGSFKKYLKQRNIDPDSLSDSEAEEILFNEYLV